MSQKSLTRFILAPEHLKGFRNAKPNTFPIEPIDSSQLVSKALVQEIPNPLYQSDWLVNLEDDIKFLEHHFTCEVGDYLWIAEAHRLNKLSRDDGEQFVQAEYMDGEKRITTLRPEDMPFDSGRKIPAIGMRRESCRFVLKVREIGVKWLDPDKRTKLVWVVAIERMPDVDLILNHYSRGILK